MAVGALSTATLLAAALAAATPGTQPAIYGVWLGVGGGGGPAGATDTPFRNVPWTPKPAFTAWGAAESRRWADPQVSKGYCDPWPLPMYMGGNPLFPMEILQGPGEIVINVETSLIPRRIYTDGRPHPKDLYPTWFGHSVGHWEGDTLVVDTVGFNGRTRPMNGYVAGVVTATANDFDPRLPATDQMHMVERIRVVGGGQYLEDEITVDDPKAYVRPFTSRRYSQRRPDLDVLEYYCADNPRPDAEGYDAEAPTAR